MQCARSFVCDVVALWGIDKHVSFSCSRTQQTFTHPECFMLPRMLTRCFFLLLYEHTLWPF